jgi:hypothetical protein
LSPFGIIFAAVAAVVVAIVAIVTVVAVVVAVVDVVLVAPATVAALAAFVTTTFLAIDVGLIIDRCVCRRLASSSLPSPSSS